MHKVIAPYSVAIESLVTRVSGVWPDVSVERFGVNGVKGVKGGLEGITLR